MKTYFYTLCFILFHLTTIYGQESNLGTITYKSPSKNLTDITIQTHKGLPRYGELYYHRGVTDPLNTSAYNKLIELKYLSTIYADMDKTKLTKYNHTSKNLKDKNSRFAQQHLLQLAGAVNSVEVLEKYFCDPSVATKCTFIDAYGQRKNVAYWGGSNKNEFHKMRSYSGYVKNHLEELQKWSNTFFKNDQEIGYLVSRGRISGKYDFKQKGYWLIIKPNIVAFTENEKKLKQEKALLPILPATAKELGLKDGFSVYPVFKVRAIPSIHRETNVQISYELERDIIEVYTDKTLTKKIGEIAIKNLISKY